MALSTDSIDLSIIIVNWNSKEYLKKCIASVLNTTFDIQYEILVIDSASFDGCDEMLQQFYPGVQFLQSDKNLGFARSNNEAFKWSKGRFLLFLNPDTELEDNAVQKLLHSLQKLPNAGIVGPQLLNGDRSIQWSCIRAFPNILNQIFDAEVLMKWFPHSQLWGMAPLFKESVMPTEVDAVSGACLMIKRSVFESVEAFTTDYFMYSEDIDLCYKIQKAGWSTYYIPTAIVVHHGGGSSSRSFVSGFSSVMLLESRWRYFCKTKPFWYCWLYRFAIFLACVVRISVVLFIWPNRRIARIHFFINRTLNKWKPKLCWALGGEKWVKKRE